MLCEKGAAVICSPWKKEHHPLLIYKYIINFCPRDPRAGVAEYGSVWLHGP